MKTTIDITKNSITKTFTLSNKERGVNKADTYFKLDIASDDFSDCADFIGLDVATDLLELGYNIKLQRYWKLALESAKNDHDKAIEIFTQSVQNDRASGESISKLKKEQSAILDIAEKLRAEGKESEADEKELEAIKVMKRIRQLEKDAALAKALEEKGKE